MADKDKKKLKVILKLPPKSSSSQLKSPTARGGAVSAAPGAAAAAGGVAFPSGAGAAAAAAVVGSKNISGLFAFSAPPSSTTSSSAPFVSSSQFLPSSAGFVGGARGGPVSQDNYQSSSAHFISSAYGGAGGRGGGGGAAAAALQDHHQSSSGHFAALASGGGGGGRGGGGGSQDLHHHHHHQQQQHHHHRHSNSSRNLQSRHGFAAAAAGGTGLSGGVLNTGASSLGSVRSSNSSSGPSASSSAAAGAAGSGSVLVSAPSPSLTGTPPPPNKRKFKTVEHAGALGVGALVVGGAGSGAGFVAGPGPGRDAGGAGKTAKVGGGRVGGAGGGKVEGGVGRTAAGEGGKTALLASGAFPVKKSHKKQVKPSIQTDGQQAHPFAGVILPPKAPSEPLSKTMLEGVLEKLQKKDTYGVFAEPVDAIQVPDYYDIIKEPMDFGTMRKKIRKVAYTTVEQFEGDIYLICSNAMRYNGPDTIYYKQARAIRDMARKSLEGIRAQLAGEIRKPVSHKKKQSPSKKSHAKKPPLSKVRLDGTGSDFASGATLAGDGDHRGWSNSTVATGKAKKGMSMEKLVGLGEDSQGAWVEQPVKENKDDMQEEPTGAAALKPMGPKDGRRPLTTEEYHRNTYKQRQLPAHGQGPPLAAVGGESRLLVPVGNQGEHAYARSLAQFGSVLGPRAWCFVAKKLELLKAPAELLGKSNPCRAGEAKVATSSQAAAGSTDSHPPVSTPSVVGIVGEALSSPSGPSHSGPVADSTFSQPSGVPQTPQAVDSAPSRPSAPNRPSVLPHIGQGVDSTPSFPSGASHIGQGVVSTPSHPSGAVYVAETGVSTPNHTSGASQVGEAVISSQNRPSGGASHDGQAGVTTPNFSSGGPSHFGHGHAIVSTTSNRPSGVSQGSMSAGGPSHVGQAVGQSLSSSGASHIGQPSSSYPVGSAIGSSDQTSGKDLQVCAPQDGGPFEMQQGSGNGRLEGAARSDSLVHKQVLGLDSDVGSEENKSVGRLGWIQGSAVSAVDQGVQGLALGATSKGLSQAWSTAPLKHGSSGYAYVPVVSSGGRDEASVQAWAQARVESLTHPVDSKRSLAPGVQAFHSQNSQVKSPANLPQILQQPSIYAEYNNLVSRLPPRQSTGLPMSSGPILQAQEHRAEAFASKSGVAEQKGSLSLHSQGSNRPAPLQQNSSQQRTMPPDLNVALLSPSALQSPPPQGSTPTGGHHPDLKLQL